MKYNNWDKDLSDSNRAIMSIADTVLPKLISGKIHSIEDSDNSMLLLMDKCSGIDLIRQDSKGLQGIAVRVQFGNSFNTFTIRAKRHTGSKTELEKRLNQVNSGYFYPAFTIQAYFDNRSSINLKSIAIVKTTDLYDFVMNSGKAYKRVSDNIFLVCAWHDLKKYGASIKIIDNNSR